MGRWATGDIDAAAPGGGESLREVFQRFLPAVREIIAKHAGQDGTLVIVAHGGVLLAGLTQLFPNVSQAFALGHMFDNTQTATGAFVDGALVCTDWHGSEPE
jgi:probable phosphoglycerate mutase